MRRFPRLMWCVACAVLVTAAGSGLQTGGIAWAKDKGPQVPPVKNMPRNLPTSAVKKDGDPQSVRATAKQLGAAVTKACPRCGGKGQVTVRGGGGGLARPEGVQCEPCDGKGRVANDREKVEDATHAVVTSIVRLAPDAKGADVALADAYTAITEHLLRKRANINYVQGQSVAALSQVKPQADKVVLVKAVFGHEIPHPTRQGEKIYIVRVAHKKQVLAVVSPRQADPPQKGGRSLVAGVIAGTVDVEVGKNQERVVIVERGFLISPNPDGGWWNDE